MRTNQRQSVQSLGTVIAIFSMFVSGCATTPKEICYLGEEQNQYYRDHSTEIDFPVVHSCTPDEIIASSEPHTIRDLENGEIRDIQLVEAVHIALQNNQIIRTAGTFQSPGNALYTNPDRISSMYDPAIQESGVLFGGRGTEAALSAFDAQFTTSIFGGRDERRMNVAGFPSVSTGNGSFNAGIAKQFGYGASASVTHSINYLDVPGGTGSQSSYSGDLNFQYRQPLLAGAGTEFTQIAGPIGQSFGGLTGVSQGVLIARINGDISLADFETAVRNLTKDVEDTYWDLYLSYRNYHTAKTAYEAAMLTWRIADLQLEGGVRTRAEVAQSRDQLFAAEAAMHNTRSQIYTAEIRLRRMMGLPVNDNTTLRPSDEPVTAEIVPDWQVSLTESLIHRVELRRQKWNIKSIELQLSAAENLVRPRLDFIGGYNVNGFGDNLIDYTNDEGPGSTGVNSFYQNLFDVGETGWNVGLQLEMPIGLRSAKAQLRNYELRLAKAQKVLYEQEKEISLELAVSFQELARTYQAAVTNMNRMIAARENVTFLEPNIREGDKLLDDLLRAQDRQAQAEVAYYQSLVEYNKALTDLQFRKGTLLNHNGVVLAEGGWDAAAYQDAYRHYKARAYANPNDHVTQRPAPFASPSPVDGVFLPGPTEADGIIYDAPVEADRDVNNVNERPLPENNPNADNTDGVKPTENGTKSDATKPDDSPIPSKPPAENVDGSIQQMSGQRITIPDMKFKLERPLMWR